MAGERKKGREKKEKKENRGRGRGQYLVMNVRVGIVKVFSNRVGGSRNFVG